MPWNDEPTYYGIVKDAVTELSSCTADVKSLVRNTFLTGGNDREIIDEIMEGFSNDVLNVERGYMTPEALEAKWRMIGGYLEDLDFTHGGELYRKAKSELPRNED